MEESKFLTSTNGVLKKQGPLWNLNFQLKNTNDQQQKKKKFCALWIRLKKENHKELYSGHVSMRSVAKYWYTAERKNRYDETFTDYKN